MQLLLCVLASAFVFGLLRWPVWSIALLSLAALDIDLQMGSPWIFREFGPPTFTYVLTHFLPVVAIVCVIGYAAGRLIAYVMGWLAGSFRTPME